MTQTKLPKAMFFDWDGTLADSYHFLLSAHNYAQRQLGIRECTSEEFGKYFGKPREQLYIDMYGDRGAEAKTHFEFFVMGRHLSDLKPMEGAAELLQALQDLGIVTGLLTNKKGDFVRAEIAQFGWGSYFTAVVAAGEASEDKPSAAPLFLGLERAEISHDIKDIWYVGDTETDLQCAHNAGCPSVFIRPPGETDVDLAAYKPLLIVGNCRELKDFLLQSTGN